MRLKMILVAGFLPILGLTGMLVLLNDQPVQASQSVLYVAAGGDCGNTGPCYGSVQSAVDGASDGDVIKVAAGIYTGVNNYSGLAQVVYVYRSVTIQGGYTTANWSDSSPGSNLTTLDAEGFGRVLYVIKNIEVAIDGLRLIGGDATYVGGDPPESIAGGGIYVSDSTITVRNSQIESNGGAYYGGGVYAANATIIISNTWILSNTASSQGGGVFLGASDAVLTGNTIENNGWNEETIYGGGLCSDGSNLVLTSNTVAGNAAGRGGGIIIFGAEGHVITLRENAITDNTAHHGGGVSMNPSSGTTLEKNTISANHADHSGGGMYLKGSSASSSFDGVFSDNVIADNRADSYGGGIYVERSGPTFIRNDIFGNVAGWYGGGLYLNESSAVLDENAISQSGGDGIWLLGSSATVKNNTIFLNRGYGLVSTTISVSSKDRIEGNTIIDNRGGGVSLGYAWLVNNIIAGNDGIGVQGGASMLNNTVARNTGADGIGVKVTGMAVMTNTILVSQTIGVYVEGTAKLEGTLWGAGAWANGTDWAGDGTIITGTMVITTFVNNNLWGDPLFVDADAGDYHITSDSPAIDHGSVADISIDIDGDRRIGIPDIGADEYVLSAYLPLILR